ncbi:hypothetical protein [Marinigracilibium pacificum]|uniref:Uncharacterized protein n=1 Tax=Marinigracilibium pacificum TaxID=2729599 RepID=A0A848J8F6_9BACT|nr:hypothetical protein [Marinigracilibium pacificum]NMM50770.1 hypothetical protein [Marinigracilibium pacificum]
MKIFNPNYIIEFRNAIESHNLKSGEIILQICEHDGYRDNYINLIKDFFTKTNIHLEKESFDINRIKRNEAISAIKFGLSTKPNYTSIDKEFNESDKNRYANGFIDFFINPDFFSVNVRIFNKDLDLNDFWETGGAILIDDNKIGLFWINDLYDKFN